MGNSILLFSMDQLSTFSIARKIYKLKIVEIMSHVHEFVSILFNKIMVSITRYFIFDRNATMVHLSCSAAQINIIGPLEWYVSRCDGNETNKLITAQCCKWP